MFYTIFDQIELNVFRYRMSSNTDDIPTIYVRTGRVCTRTRMIVRVRVCNTRVYALNTTTPIP